MSKALLERLDRTAAELRSVARGTVVRAGLAALVGTVVCLVLIDWLGRFSDPGLRWLFTATVIGATAGVAWWTWRRRRPRDATRLGVARRLQQAQPQLGSRLASAVEFAGGDANDATAGSAELRRAVVLGAAQDAEALPFEAIVDRTPLRRASRFALAAIAVTLLFGLVNASALGTGIYRLAMPWADAPWPRRDNLKLIDPPTTLARGATFEAIAVNSSGEIPDDTRIEYRFASNGERAARSEKSPAKLIGNQAVASRDNVTRSFSYRFVGGDDDTMAWIDLAVLDPPVASDLKLAIAPPAYSGLPASTSSGPLNLLAGSTIDASGISDKRLESVTIVLPDESVVAAELATPEAKTQRFRASWEADPTRSTATYEIRLAATTGVTGVVGPNRYEVVADTPPKVEWASGIEETVVTTKTLVQINGSVTDDLAIQKIETEWVQRAPGVEEAAEPRSVSIADRGVQPPNRDSLNGSDKQEVVFDWDLESLELAEGTELLVWLTATDYQPAEGRTAEPLRLTILSDDDYRERLAEAQSRLLGQVQQALKSQREVGEATQSLGADTRDADSLDRSSLDRLTSIEFQQRETSDIVTDPTSGATAAAKRLLDQLERSRVEAPELASQLSGAGELLEQLGKQELPAARGDLADARRAGQRALGDEDKEDAQAEFGDRLGEAENDQQAAIERLEQVADLLTSWADFQRFASEAAALEANERELAGEAQKQAAATASKLMPDPTQAEREKLLTRQAETTRRFDKLRSAMQKLLNKQPEQAEDASTAAQSVGDALAEADDADIAGRLRDASRDLARGRLGSAAQQQTQAAEGLKSMLDALRQRTTTDPKELAKRLKEEKQKLAKLQDEVEQLKQQPDTRQTEAARKQAGAKAARLGRRLERLTASQAAASAAQGAQQAAGQQQDQQPQPDKQQELAQAEKSFDQAQKQIDQRIDELEDQRTQRVLDQLANRIGGYIERQSTVLDGTLELAGTKPDGEREGIAQQLATNERDLSDELSTFSEELSRRAVFELALRGAAEKTASAARRLDEARVDRRTQRLETAALARLRQVEEVLRQEQQDQQEREQGRGGGGGGAAGEPPPPSPIDVAELKMLRLMQLEVLGQTDAYEADTATARRAKKPLPPDWKTTGKELASEQRRLAELALELSERDNDPEAEDEESPTP